MRSAGLARQSGASNAFAPISASTALKSENTMAEWQEIVGEGEGVKAESGKIETWIELEDSRCRSRKRLRPPQASELVVAGGRSVCSYSRDVPAPNTPR